MNSQVDLRQLAVDREGTDRDRSRARRHVLTRYVLPAALACGFLALATRAAWDRIVPPQPVTVVPVFATRAAVQAAGSPLFQAAGWIEPRPTPIGVPALAVGVIDQLLVVEDEPVKAGQAVAILFDQDAELACDRALAELELRGAELESARAALAAAATRLEQPVHLVAAWAEAEGAWARLETQLQQLPFDIRQAKAERDAARKAYDVKASAEGVVASLQIDQARSLLEAAEARLEGLQASAEALRQEQAALVRRRDALAKQRELLTDEIQARNEAEAHVQAAAARVQQARVAVAEAELMLDRMTVRAPVDGRIYQLVAQPGSHVGGGRGQSHGRDANVVVTLYQPKSLQVRVDVRFEDLPQISRNQPVRIENPALPNPLTGRVLFVSSEADIQKNTLPVKVAIESPPAVLKPEMLVDVTFLSPSTEAASSDPQARLRLYAPRRLVQQDEQGAYVWLADRSAGLARKQQIQTGAAGPGDTIEVVQGLTAASRLIAGGTEGLQHGVRIRIAGEDRVLGTSTVPSPADAQVETGDNSQQGDEQR